MANYTYTKIEKPHARPPYYMLKVDGPPRNFDEIHVTIPQDDPSAGPRRIQDIMWKFPHVTFVWQAGRNTKKLHCFIKQVRGNYHPFDSRNNRMNLDANFREAFYNIVEDDVVVDALFADSTF